MVMLYFDGLFGANQYQFTFSCAAAPALKLTFDRPVAIAPPTNRPFKRRRALSDVDGRPNVVRKKRRLRLHLITSRLSQPYSQPASNIANRGTSKIPLWARKRPTNKNYLRKAAIMNRMRLRLIATKEHRLQEQEKKTQPLALCQLPPSPTLRPLEPLPPSPLGLSNYDALDLEDDLCCCDWADEETDHDGQRNSEKVDTTEDKTDSDKDIIYSDFNIMNPVKDHGDDFEYLDALDGISPYGFSALPSPPPEEAIMEILKEKERQSESYFVRVDG